MLDRIKELCHLLNDASKAYYGSAEEIMSNKEYDALYDELVKLEASTGCILSNSPTQRVGCEVQTQLRKITHDKPMLSLDKTKSIRELEEWLSSDIAILSWKLDGLTLVLTYNNGELEQAVTRGNGTVGEDVTENAKFLSNVPLKIPYLNRLVVRGEALITYSSFNKINAQLEDSDKYKNARNLCSGSIRQLDPSITRKRNVKFYAFSLVSSESVEFNNLHSSELEWLSSLGFDVVPYRLVAKVDLESSIKDETSKIKSSDIPCDGLVLLFNDIKKGADLGVTAHAPKNSIAFKWSDDTYETVLRDIEWSPSRTGLINPVAIFDPVQIDGTTVSRASVHNISIMEELALGVGDIITVYKANLIIPQVDKNLTRSSTCKPPSTCPVCGESVTIKSENGKKMLYCPNPGCTVKKAQSFEQACSRDALNVEGLSESTLQKFMQLGFIKKFSDIYHLNQHRDEIINLPSFGKASYQNIISAIEKSRKTTCEKFIYALCLPNVGVVNAKNISRSINNNPEKLFNISVEDLKSINGIGDILASSIVAKINEPAFKEEALLLMQELTFVSDAAIVTDELKKKVFVITGSLKQFNNRKELEAFITLRGGEVASSVTQKTSYLINNDTRSASSKNKKAKELGVMIISEEEFVNMVNRKE